MISTKPLRRRWLTLFAPIIGCFFSALALHAQTSGGTGTITGRVFNPATGEYVRNAEIRVQGTNLAAVTEAGGYYSIANVPAGEATVSVNYTGYISAPATVNVTAGQVATRDFELAGVDGRTPAGDMVKMEAFVVSSDREGNAKAIMQQRNSMNVGMSVASDVFGDVAEGNVGEFLKFLPGVELEYVEADTRGPRLGGMDPEYAGVSIDGMKLASADAFVQYGSTENGSTGSGSRSFGFEQVSINSIESIEINRVGGADMDADAPAGTINLKTKRAFDSKGRRIAWQLSTTMNSEEFTLSRSFGPDDGRSLKFKPNALFEYSDVFLDNRLGILLSLSESNLYNEQYRIDHTYNRTTTATDTRPQVLTALSFKDGPKWTERFTASLTADYKFSRDLKAGLTVAYNAYDARFYNRTVSVQAATNNTQTTGRTTVTGDGVLNFGTGTAAGTQRRIGPGGSSGFKFTNTITINPNFEYRRGPITVDGSLAFSRSKNQYQNLSRGAARSANVSPLTNVGFTASRSSVVDADWHVTQTSGLDWANLANYTNPTINDEGRYGLNEVINALANVKYVTKWSWPTYFKVGAKYQQRKYHFENAQPIYTWSYVGPGGNTFSGFNATTGQPILGTAGTFALYPSAHLFDMGASGGLFRSIGGGAAPAFASRDALGALFNSNPEYFVDNSSPGNWETYFRNSRRNKEAIPSAYIQGNTRIGKWQVQAGLRWEQTEKSSSEFNPLTNPQVAAAGFPMSGNITVTNPNTGQVFVIPSAPASRAGAIYKWTSQPRRDSEGSYDNFFPSVTAKYRMNENLILDFGYAKAIKRPDINKLSGAWNFNETTFEITIPNPDLEPELSEKFVVSAGYYFGKASSLTVTVSETKIKNIAEDNEVPGDEIPEHGGLYDDWTFILPFTGAGERTFRNMGIDYRQQLSFLPRDLSGSSISASYSRTYADQRRRGMAPHVISGSVNARYKNASLRVSGVWTDDTPWTGTVGVYRRHKLSIDLNGSYKVYKNLSLFFHGRNVFNESHRVIAQIGSNYGVLQRLENYGANWTFGVKGNF